MYDVIVIGVGTMGAAACDVLARRGVKVLGIDQFSPPHDRGSHHGDTRMFRMAYYEHPDYVPLLKRAYELWQGILCNGKPVFHQVGGLYMGRPDGELVGQSARAAAEHGLEHERLSHDDLAHRFPQFKLPPDFGGLYEPRGGYVDAENAVAAMITRAEAAGATIARNQRVVKWEDAGARVRVTTSSDEYTARALIVTCGAWTSKLMTRHNLGLVVSRQALGWVMPVDPVPFVADGLRGFPCWGIDGGDGSLYYGFPLLPGQRELKIARHIRGSAADPDQLRREVTPVEEADFRAVIPKHLPAADGPTCRTRVCMYTNSHDSHFIVDRLSSHPNIVIACGFSGHGFKFAPVIGEAVADLAMHGKSLLPIGFLGLGRFRNEPCR